MKKKGKLTAEEKMKILCDRPEEGKVYALTGVTGAPCIANRNTWKESEVKNEK